MTRSSKGKCGVLRPPVIAMAVLASMPSFAQEGLIRDFIGIGGALIINEMNNRNSQPRRQTNAPQRRVDPEAARRDAEKRERMRLIQTRLNSLGFDAGTPDGVSGPRTRRAIGEFLTSIGALPADDLTDEQVAVLDEYSNGFGGPGPSGAFPSLAAPGQNVPQAQAFPSLGTPLAAPAASATAAFPALGASAASTAPTSAFPTLGAPASTPSSSAFPTLAAAPAPAQMPAFPVIAGTPRTEDKNANGEAVQAAAAILADDLVSEVGKAGFDGLEEQPSVLGVRLGSSVDDLKTALSENSFEACVGEDVAKQCSRETATLNDTIKAWSAGEEGVWAFARMIQFKEPVPADFVRKQFSETYPVIVSAPGGLVSSAPECAITGQSVQALASLFDSRVDPAGTADVPQPLLQLATSCPVAYSVAFNEGNNLVAAVQVLLFDGTSVVRHHNRARSHRESQLGADLKF